MLWLIILENIILIRLPTLSVWSFKLASLTNHKIISIGVVNARFFYIIFFAHPYIPVKTLLQDLTRKGHFSCIPARSRRILQDLASSCRNARKKDLFLEDLARAFLLGWLAFDSLNYSLCLFPSYISTMPLCILMKFVLLFILCIFYKLKLYKLKLLNKLTTEHTLHSRVKLSITQNLDCYFS